MPDDAMNHPSTAYLPPILVVDDSDDDFDTVAQAAQRAGIRNQLVHARDAEQARAALAATPPPAFAFMLLDCSLPGDDGLSLLKQLRQHPLHGCLPVVVLTASINPRDRNAFYAAGANAYHVKTVSFSDSLATLRHVFDYWLTHTILPANNALSTEKSK